MSNNNLKLFSASETFTHLPPKPRYAKQTVGLHKPAWEEGIVTLKPGTPQEYQVFVRWRCTVPADSGLKVLVERVCAQAAREHSHSIDDPHLITEKKRSTIHATTRSQTRPRTSLASNYARPVPQYTPDDPHVTADFGPSLPSTPTQTPLLTESAHIYCGYPPPSHGGPPKGAPLNYDNMTIWRDGCLGKWGVDPKERIPWWRIEGSSRGLDWGRGGSRSGVRK
ncbi:hypothetical protein HYFRA_00003158 [Hymenoscyphus fraxineus]|uniref:Uncharacterized protein n=1 Tax=Hymenoscyphus fraxineus TaxID=746836 RepID=A0A9N9KRS1_9HELO|nr:hypothetical protein HYFRA_00003158 [Hymenoscyphus fraxineus]